MREFDDLKPAEKVDLTLSKNIYENLEKFEAFLGESSDIIIRKFKLGLNEIPCAVVFVDGLIDKEIVNNHILKSFMCQVTILEENRNRPIDNTQAFEEVKEHVISIGEIEEVSTLKEAMHSVLSGDVVIIIDGFNKFIAVSAKGWASRGITEPEGEVTIRGAREGFTETIRFNTALLRRRCKDPNFVIKSTKIGRRSNTDISYAYIRGVANPKFITELERRLSNIDIDAILDSGQVEQLIQDDYLTPFPQIQATERPDKAIANIFEGRIVILVDNSPFALIVPATFQQFFQSPDDYSERWMFGSIIRFLRWMASFFAVLTPGIYIAIASFHPGFIPTDLAISVAASRATVPFPVFVEAILMEITIELLRESGARLPKPIGSTISIVGAIIIGDASVRAGIASPIMVIIVAITAISSFIIPTYSLSMTIRMLRFPVMILAAILGIYGVILGFIIIFSHLVTLKSFGVDYFIPQAPMYLREWRDYILRLPIQTQKFRPESLDPLDKKRKKD
ncbi:MAG TPA: spore germination protein [Clostridiales bacterium]|nr:spore germination protein [Clostridiales bacterium]